MGTVVEGIVYVSRSTMTYLDDRENLGKSWFPLCLVMLRELCGWRISWIKFGTEAACL